MQELLQLETSVLMDMLAALTADYSRMLKEGTSNEEFSKCSLAIKSVQTEIDSRKKKAAEKLTPDYDISYSRDYTE